MSVDMKTIGSCVLNLCQDFLVAIYLEPMCEGGGQGERCRPKAKNYLTLTCGTKSKGFCLREASFLVVVHFISHFKNKKA